MKDKSHILKNTKGNAAIEFALVLPLLLLLFSGVINFGLILANKNQLNDVVSAGMLFAFGNSSVPLVVTTAMTASTTNLSPLSVTATPFCQCVDGSNPGCTKRCPDGSVVATYLTLTATSQVDLIALDFVLTNPFVTTVTGTVRTQN
jgi:Flp pilus assembly protein TadG